MATPGNGAGGAIGDLLARQEITEQIYRYCRGLDRMDLELALACWHPDGTADFGALASAQTGLAARAVPIAEHFARAWDYRRAFFAHSHQTTNILIDVRGELARSESASIAVLQRRLDDGSIAQDIYWGRWLDAWSRRGGRWAIDHRQAVLDCEDHCVHPAHDGSADGAAAASPSRRDRDDPSYRLFAFG